MKETKGVWVLAESIEGHISRVSLELLSKAHELAAKFETGVTAVLIGNTIEQLTPQLAKYGAETVYLLEHAELRYYQSEVYASLLVSLFEEHIPEILLIGATDMGRDLAPRVAAKLSTGLTAHCIDFKLEEYNGAVCLHQIVPGWGGHIMVDMVCPERRPQMATVKPGIFDLAPVIRNENPRVVKIPVELNGNYFRARTEEVVIEEPSGTPLEEAEIVVAAGWGVRVAGVFKLVEELTEILGGTLGGTRPMVDNGFIPEDKMIGQSGKVVSPNLFISLGASGAMHFTTGFAKSKFIMALDQNPKAPIFEIADIGIVGDLCEVLPCLIEEVQKLRL